MPSSSSGQALPWLPPGYTTTLPRRGDVFYRYHRHTDLGVPVVLLLHGWTASADLQFFTAYEALAEICSFVGIDHRGHGRGLRTVTPFELEDAADDAAALVEFLGVGPVVVVGYSMGGPIALLLAQRYPHLVAGLVLEATAMEWEETWFERLRWKTVRVVGPLLRSWAYPRTLRFGLRKLLGVQSPLARYADWLGGEIRRNDAFAMVQAGQALSRFHARSWAGSLGKPAAMLITTRDHLVKPFRQRELAALLDAEVIEISADHLAAWLNHEDFAASTVTLVRRVLARAEPHDEELH